MPTAAQDPTVRLEVAVLRLLQAFGPQAPEQLLVQLVAARQRLPSYIPPSTFPAFLAERPHLFSVGPTGLVNLAEGAGDRGAGAAFGTQGQSRGRGHRKPRGELAARKHNAPCPLLHTMLDHRRGSAAAP